MEEFLANLPKVTIAVPFYNAEKYLSLAIDSIVWQTYENWELLLIDDGSTDGSMKIAKEYEIRDNRIKLYSDGKNMSLGFRLNQIPTLVTTEYLMRMDADDIMHPRKIEKQLEVLMQNSEIDVLGTNAYSIDENNNVVGIRLAHSDENTLSVDSFIHPTIIAKRKWFLENPYDVQALRIEDLELWYRTRKQNNFKVLVEPLFFYREFGDKYYKKYFKGNKSMWYVLQKHNFEIKMIKVAIKYYVSGIYYYINSILGRENKLILKRNQTILSPKNFEDYL